MTLVKICSRDFSQRSRIDYRFDSRDSQIFSHLSSIFNEVDLRYNIYNNILKASPKL
jgi:hypothetical protein